MYVSYVCIEKRRPEHDVIRKNALYIVRLLLCRLFVPRTMTSDACTVRIDREQHKSDWQMYQTQHSSMLLPWHKLITYISISFPPSSAKAKS